jgi:hypothetical protein
MKQNEAIFKDVKEKVGAAKEIAGKVSSKVGPIKLISLTLI